MAETYDVVAKVISQKGTCNAEHKVGDEFIIGFKTPAGMCGSAYAAIFPAFRVLRFGGSFPYSSDPEAVTVACPDAENPLVFELRRVRK